MNKRNLSYPAWMHYAATIRPKLEAQANRQPKRPNGTYKRILQSSYVTACEKHGYSGTGDDWLYLLKYARLPIA